MSILPSICERCSRDFDLIHFHLEKILMVEHFAIYKTVCGYCMTADDIILIAEGNLLQREIDEKGRRSP